MIDPVAAQEPHQPYLRLAEIEIDPSQIEPYRAAVQEQIEAAVRLEPGVLALYSVADKENPSHVFVFELYADVEAYKSHLETAHFKKYKAITQNMVKSLKLRDAVPILFDFLADKDENVRRAAADALTTLTHRSQEAGIANVEAAAQARRAWMAWWSGYGKDAKIYGPEDCANYLAGQ